MTSPRRTRGVSLAEQMTTVAVLAITLALGVPTFQTLQVGTQRAQAPAELVAACALARSEAARRGVPVTLCASTDGQTCDSSRAPAWPGGWIIFLDIDMDKTVDTPAEQVLHAVRFERPVFTLTPQCPTSPCTIASGVTFRDTGYPVESDIGRFLYHDGRGYQVLTLGFIGRLEVTATGSGTGPT